MTATRVCTQCKVEHPITNYRKAKADKLGRHSICQDCLLPRDREYNRLNRMYVNGQPVPKSHPLFKPGKYKTLDDAWSHVEIDNRTTEGEVYIIRSPAYCNWLKVGKAVSSEDRLNGYQTSSPFRDYVLEYWEHFDNRHEAEAAIHRLLEKHKDCHDRKNEWFKTYIPTVKEVMNEYRDSLRHRDQQNAQYDLVLCN